MSVTQDPVTPYPDALATFNMIGSDNANFLVHDGYGHCTVFDPSDCTWNNLIGYFVNGNLPPRRTRRILTSGTIPPDETICATDNGGKNNIFVENYSPPTGGSGGLSEGRKIGLGVGLGVGILLLIVICVLIALLMKRRGRARQGSAGSQPMAENKATEADSVTSARNEAVI